MPYECFTKPYHSLAQLILAYGVDIWGTRSFSCINAGQHQAECFYLGLGKYPPNCALQGELDCKTQEHANSGYCCIRLWCCLLNLEHNRLTKHIHIFL